MLNGYAGVEGWDQPNEFVFMVDDEDVSTAKVGGPEDHEASVKDAIDDDREARRAAEGTRHS